VRQRRTPDRKPLVRFHSSNQIGPARDYPVLDISGEGCAVLLPSELMAPQPETVINRLEVELDDQHVLFTDARVQYVAAQGSGTHRIGCCWLGMPPAGRRTLARWLATAPPSALVQIDDAGAGYDPAPCASSA
jgi:hypothetical protein